MSTIYLDRVPGTFFTDYKPTPNKAQNLDHLKKIRMDRIWNERTEFYQKFKYVGNLMGPIALNLLMHPFDSRLTWSAPFAAMVATAIFATCHEIAFRQSDQPSIAEKSWNPALRVICLSALSCLESGVCLFATQNIESILLNVGLNPFSNAAIYFGLFVVMPPLNFNAHTAFWPKELFGSTLPPDLKVVINN